MGADGGLAFVSVNPKSTVEEATRYLSPFFTFDVKGCDRGDNSRSNWYEENQKDLHWIDAIIVPYGTDIGEYYLMADEVNKFVGFLHKVVEEIGMSNVTFGDIVLEQETRPTWNPILDRDKRFYRVIEEANEMHEVFVSDWLAGLEQVLRFNKSPFGGKTVNVARVETWT